MSESQYPSEELSVSESGVRLDAFLASATRLSRTRAAALIEEGLVSVNGRAREKRFLLSEGDRVSVEIPPDEEIDAVPECIPLDVFYEDDHLIVVNKPQGMVVHPAPGNYSGTLVNALLYHCKDSLSGINGRLRPGIVHRIDKDTSGLVVVAKDDETHIGLTEMFKTHNFERKYEAICYGKPQAESGTVHLAIGRSKKDRKKMAFYPPGTPGTKDGITHFRVLESFAGYSRLELILETGRTHQIRVHMLSLSCPVLADPLYAPGRKSFGLTGQCLHAKYISFRHPISGEPITLEAPLPPYFQQTLELLRKEF
ncbi:MAG: RluA family pseudouridine synthase [Clostridia bacterium]|nr:RluA family pseudouridine synthase [Clostridia bacterium]